MREASCWCWVLGQKGGVGRGARTGMRRGMERGKGLRYMGGGGVEGNLRMGGEKRQHSSNQDHQPCLVDTLVIVN
jgi:hypothetical protein